MSQNFALLGAGGTTWGILIKCLGGPLSFYMPQVL
jgi:hypothetical protein